MEMKDQATIAARLEKDFDAITTFVHANKEINGFPGLEGYTLLSTEPFSHPNYPNSPTYAKAMVVKSPNGSIFVHFRGTGDGNWIHNAAAYGGPDSPMQEWAADYFDRAYADYGRDGEIYVTGHSQGGNNAQFAAIRSTNADKITACIALDAPGFSNNFVNKSQTDLGLTLYKNRANKIWAFNGDSDYVSCLGQQTIIAPEQSYLLKTNEYNDITKAIYSYHDIKGKLNDKGEFLAVYNDPSKATAIRQFMLALNNEIVNLDIDQARLATIAMKYAENLLGKDDMYHINLTDNELEELVGLVMPIFPKIFEIVARNPEMISAIVTQLGLNLDPAVITILEKFAQDCNKYSPEEWQRIMNAVSSVLVIKDGKITLDSEWQNYLTLENADAVMTLAPVVSNMLENTAIEFLINNGFPPVVINFISKHGPKVASMALQFLGAVVLIGAFLKKAWKNHINKFGRNYSSNNPYIKLDTDSLRRYAKRITTVNNRVSSLRRSLQNLYWQVGFLDLYELALTNLLTRESATLDQVAMYLNNAAYRFDIAENRTRGFMEE